MTNSDFHWLIGLMEGEGCFAVDKRNYGKREYPRIHLRMTDEDVIERAANLFDRGYRVNLEKHKSSFHIQFGSKHAIDWMVRLLPFMGKRRSTRIREILYGQGIH
jgi:hypothetical protein